MAMPRLRISPDDLAAVEWRARHAFPAECCGLLIGRADAGAVRVVRVEPCANEAADPLGRFTISPEALLAAYRSARDRGEQVVGTYHSHPRGAAVPSAADRESAWPGASYLIVGMGSAGVGERRSWRLDEVWVEQELCIGSGEGS